MTQTFQQRYNLPGGESIVVIGPPKTGKSTFAASVCEVVSPERVALLCPKPREATSEGYKRHALTERAELFTNNGFVPDLDMWEAGAFKQLLRRVVGLYDSSDVDAVVLDVGTEAAMLAGQELLAKNKAATPRELANPFDYYTHMAHRVSLLCRKLSELTVGPNPKFVIVTWHAQAAKESEGKGVAFEGGVLPAIEGSYREKLAGDFGSVVYSKLLPARSEYDKEAKKMVEHPSEFVLQVKAEGDRHAGVAGARVEQTYIPNEFRVFFEMIGGSCG